MNNFKTIITTFSLVLFSSSSWASAGFYENTVVPENIEAVFDFGFGLDYDRLVDIQGTNFGPFTATDQFDLKGGIAHVFRDNGSNITGVSLNYRVYEIGTPAPVFSSVSLAWQADIAFSNNQRWVEVGLTVDLLSGLTVTGNYNIEMYYSATTNGINAAPIVYWSNTSMNYIGTFSYTAPLPVKLVDFSVYLQDDIPVVNWSTASEYNASHFNIYSSDNEQIAKSYLGSEQAQGNTTLLSEYTFVAPARYTGQKYFYLEQVDYDGKTVWYGPVVLTRDQNTDITAFFTRDGMVQVNGDLSGFDEIQLVDIEGREIIKARTSEGISKIVVPNLRRGIYLLQLQKGENIRLLKLIK